MLFTASFLILISSGSVMGQTSDSWTLYRELDAVKIEYTTEQCGDDVITEFNFIKLTNKTSQPVSVTFKIEYYYNGTCTTCTNEEYRFTFALPANGSIQADCSLSSNTGRLAIIKRYVNRNYGHPLDRFELSDIVVH